MMNIEHLYYQILRIRLVEEKIIELFPTDQIKSPIHLSIGQESIPVTICNNLSDKDLVTNTYRSHASYLAKGGALNPMMAELFGKAHGCCKGKGGSMHLAQMSVRHMVTSAVVGTTHAVAAGAALAFKMQHLPHIVVSFFGDGSTEEGAFYETLNFAALRNLPILFVCENNRLAIHTPIENRWSQQNLLEKTASFGIHAKKGSSHHLENLWDLAQESVTYVRKQQKPMLIEIETYRYMEHVGPISDHTAPYRNIKEYESWKSKDPLIWLEQSLSSSQIKDIKQRIQDEIEQAVEFAKIDSYPEPETLYEDVYA